MKASSEPMRTAADVRREGFRALLERLGAADAIRFLMHYDAGRGDYSLDRHRWLDGTTMEDTIRSIRKREQPDGGSA